MTPFMREAMRSISFWLLGEGRLERMSTAVEVRTVAMGFRPAAFIVSPDSGGGQVSSCASFDWKPRTDEIHNAVRDPKRTSSLHTPTHIFYPRLQLRLHPPSLSLPIHIPPLQPPKIRLRNPHKTSNHIPPHQILRPLQTPILRNLNLQPARPKPQIQDLLHALVLMTPAVGFIQSFMLSHLITACDT